MKQAAQEDPVAYDVVVIGGGPMGLSAAHECSKVGNSVLLLEQFSLFNYDGSSGDIVRMYRVMYTEDYMADLAKDSMSMWRDLERDSNEELVLRTGLLNFGDPSVKDNSPEGTLLGPLKNMERLGLQYSTLSKEQLETLYPFKDLPAGYQGFYSPDCGCINVPQLLRCLHKLCQKQGAQCFEYAPVSDLTPVEGAVLIQYTLSGKACMAKAQKVIVTCGAYVNHILRPLGFELDLQIWELPYSSFSVTQAKPNLFPSMWFQFDKADSSGSSQLFYGFPELPWGPLGMVHVALDASRRIISDPAQRRPGVDEDQLALTQDFIKHRLHGVDLAPNLTGSCLQTNVADNNFVLDFVPLPGPHAKSMVLFTAGWGMKFVPLRGKYLAEMALGGEVADRNRHEHIGHFRISRKVQGKPILHQYSEGPGFRAMHTHARPEHQEAAPQASGSSILRHQAEG